MLEWIRHGNVVKHLRRSLRDKAVRVVREAVAPMHGDRRTELMQLREEVDRLRKQVESLGERVQSEAERAIESVRSFELRSRRDIFAAGEREAAVTSARFVVEHMPSARLLPHPRDTLRDALSLAPKGGLALEFGVYSGSTLAVIAEQRADGRVYGFDSFSGLPEHWRAGFPEGTFDVRNVPEVEGAELVVGWFDEVLPGFLDEHGGVVDFLHVDCDLYSSTRTVLEHVGPRLHAGSVVLFDEYFNYPGWQRHEYLAWQEYVERAGVEFDYESYTLDNEQVAVRITHV